MSPTLNARILTALALILSFALCLCVPARADSDNGKVREAGPEDGFLCCNGAPFLFHGDEVLTTTGRAGIFQSERHGERWQRSMKGLVGPNGVSPFVVYFCQAPSEPRIVYAIAGLGGPAAPFNGLFSSDDFGETWTRRASVESFGFAFCAVDAADPRTVYITASDSNFVFQLWKSTDGGQTVQIFGANLPACAVGGSIFPRRGILYVSSDCIYASTNGGSSFYALAAPPGLPGVDVSPDGRVIFVSTQDASFHPTGTFRSTDGGVSFVPVSGLPNGIGGVLAFDPTDPSRIYANDGLLHVSTDGGLSFVLLPASNDPRFLGPVQQIAVDGRGSVYLSTVGGPFRTDDGGRTFRSLLDGFRASAVQDLAFDADGDLLIAVQSTQPVFRHTHDLSFRPIGNTLIPYLNRDNDSASVASSPNDTNVVVVATRSHGVFRTDNGGQSWTPAAAAGSIFYANSRVVFPTSSRVYLAAPFLGLYRSDDAGRSFALLSSLPFGAIGVDAANPSVLYVGTYNGSDGLFKSTDAGQTLQNLGQPGVFSAIAVDHRNSHVVYAGERFGQVIRSLDGGRTFASASTGLAGAGVHGLAQDSRGTLFVWLRGGGLFSSNDGASHWQPVDTGEALHRSGVEAGRGALVADPRRPGRVYLGNAGVIQIED